MNTIDSLVVAKQLKGIFQSFPSSPLLTSIINILITFFKSTNIKLGWNVTWYVFELFGQNILELNEKLNSL